jgi:hypothetical protein
VTHRRKIERKRGSIKETEYEPKPSSIPLGNEKEDANSLKLWAEGNKKPSQPI